MIYNAITVLLVIITLLAFVQPNRVRMVAAMVFVSVTLTHELLFQFYDSDDLGLSEQNDGLLYYGSAIVFDMGIAEILNRMRRLTGMAIELMLVCLVSAIANLIGWGLWFFWEPVDWYRFMFVGIYAWAAWILAKRKKTDVGIDTLAGWEFGYAARRSANIHRLHGR